MWSGGIYTFWSEVLSFIVELTFTLMRACTARGKVIRLVVGTGVCRYNYMCTKENLNGTLVVDLHFEALVENSFCNLHLS